jgi:hypothetical protein
MAAADFMENRLLGSKRVWWPSQARARDRYLARNGTYTWIPFCPASSSIRRLRVDQTAVAESPLHLRRKRSHLPLASRTEVSKPNRSERGWRDRKPTPPPHSIRTEVR